jgi:hypothetical protein
MRNWVPLLAFLLCSGSGMAAEMKAKVDVVRVKGYGSNGALTLEVSAGPAATRAIRVYSEPSHTLLVFVQDTEFAASSEGQKWRSEVSAEQAPRAGSVTNLPEGRPRFVIEGRPATDDRIATWVFGDWPDGSAEDRLVGDGRVGNGDFEFSIAVPMAAAPDSSLE